MTRFVDFSSGIGPGGRRVVNAWQAVHRQPSWIVRLTLTVFLLVIAVPILLLVIIAALVASVAFTAFWSVNRIQRALRGERPDARGRENVRVIRRE